MDHTTWTVRKFWVIASALAFTSYTIGYYVDAPDVTDPEVVTETQEVEVVKDVEVPNREALDRLDAVDQQIFEQSGIVIEAQGIALSTAGDILGQYPNFNLSDIEAGTSLIQEQTGRIETAREEVERLRQQRLEVLDR